MNKFKEKFDKNAFINLRNYREKNMQALFVLKEEVEKYGDVFFEVMKENKWNDVYLSYSKNCSKVLTQCSSAADLE